MTALAALSVSELFDVIDARPADVLREATRRRRADPADAADRARLHWVIGMSERELGNLERAATEIDAAVAISVDAGDQVMAASIKCNLAFVVGRLGQLDRALTLLDEAEPHLAGVARANVLRQRAMVLHWRGELTSAAEVLESACRVLVRHGDRAGELRARVNLGAFLSQTRDYRAAERHLDRAVELATDLCDPLLLATARHNLGYMAMMHGDIPRALREYEAAEDSFEAVGATSYLPRLFADHAQALADAGLLDDAEPLLGRAVEMLHEHGNEIEIAGVLVNVAEVRLAQSNTDGARVAAEQAADWYQKQGRTGWVALSESLKLQAAARGGDRSPTVVQALDDVAARLVVARLGAEATRAQLVAAQVRAESGEVDDPVPAATRRVAARGLAADQILLAHVDAVAAQQRDDRSAARRAISRGLAVAMSSQAALGSIETRAHAAVHGYALTEIGARMAIADRRPRELLARIEATRLMSSRPPELRPPADAELARLLSELRCAETSGADAALSDEKRRQAEAARARLERDVRRRSRSAEGGPARRVVVQHEIDEALELLGERQLLAHARVDGKLHAVSVIQGRARLHDLGPVDDVTERIEAVAFSLHRLNRLQGSEGSRTAAAEMLYAFADELAEIVLPPIVAESLEPVVIVPTAVLHDVPWGLLPPLSGRAVAVNSSVSAWGHAERTLRSRRSTLLDGIEAGFVAGPGLDFADIEVEHLASRYVAPVVLSGQGATVEACTSLLSEAELVHIACHGTFRRDNPMFSSLHVADGALNVYDLEGLERLPVVVVLSSCSVANAKVVQGGSLLGLANAFTTLGAASVIAPLTPISDASAVMVMDRLHQHLVAGADPAAALAAATMSHDVADPTAAAFISLGA